MRKLFKIAQKIKLGIFWGASLGLAIVFPVKISTGTENLSQTLVQIIPKNSQVEQIATGEQIKNLREAEFKRLCGVKPKLFQEMVEVLQPQSTQTRQRGGQPKLSIEDQLLIALEYWREDSTPASH